MLGGGKGLLRELLWRALLVQLHSFTHCKNHRTMFTNTDFLDKRYDSGWCCGSKTVWPMLHSNFCSRLKPDGSFRVTKSTFPNGIRSSFLNARLHTMPFYTMQNAVSHNSVIGGAEL